MSTSCRQFIRSIYLHGGPRVAGLKRDPAVAGAITTGTQPRYDTQAAAPIQSFLTEKYQIAPELALQVLTHKSYLNGIKPYNEKLAAMGQKCVNLYFAKYVTEAPTQSEVAVNGHNLDVLGSPMARELSGKLAMGLFAKTQGFSEVMFWKSANHELSFEASGEMSVSAHVMYALIGAVTLTHGKKAAEQFIHEKLLQSSTPSLEEITVKIVEDDASKSA
ncbi:large ribosomal subunit protein mL57 [Diutina catenulata]